MALIGTLTDNFNAGTIDSGKWTNNYGSQISIVSGELNLTTSTGAAYYELESAGTWELTGSEAVIELVNAGNQSITSFEAYPLQLVLDGNNKLTIYVIGGTMVCRRTQGGANTTVDSVTYNSTDHRWLRIREDSGTIYFDASADGTSWNNLGTTTVSFAITALTVFFTVGTWQAEATTTAMIIDNFNIPPSTRRVFMIS